MSFSFRHSIWISSSRRSRGPFCFSAYSIASSAVRIPRSPMEWMNTWNFILSSRSTTCLNSSGGYNDDWLRVAAVKLYIDDVIEPHTAALLEPYADRPDTRGELDYPPDEFKDVVARLDRMKFQVFVHSIGDRGIRTALDAIEYAEKQNGPRDRRDELVHIECLSEKDIPRFKQLGVIACMQPRHCAPDITGQWAKAVGPQRWKYAWAFRSLRASGARLAFASDWNVADLEPLIGIYTALTRKGLDGKPEGGWIPEQTIDLETAIRGYTINGA